jgi:hypothetical protein
VVVSNQALTVNQVFANESARLIPYALIVIALIIGVSYFKKEAPNFAENL